MNTQSTNLGANTQKTLCPTGLYELVLVAGCAHGKLPMYSVNARDHFNCSLLLSYDLYHETDAAKRKGLGRLKIESSYFCTYIERGKY